jgi:hypothetical protein
MSRRNKDARPDMPKALFVESRIKKKQNPARPFQTRYRTLGGPSSFPKNRANL